VVDHSDLRPATPRWSRADTLAIAVITALACGMRGYRLSSPPFIYSDELFYAREACNYVYRSPATCGIPLDAVSAHPPMGKWLISLGIRAFGWEPFGWRIAALVAGTLTVALLYVVARRLLGSTRAAVFASGLLAIDFLHLVQSRIAMLDAFLTLFAVAAFAFVVIDRTSPQTERSAWQLRPWLIAAGVAGGAAVATKWVGVLALLGSLTLAAGWMLRDARTNRTPVGTVVRKQWLTLVVAFGLAPGAVYVATYGPRVEGRVLAVPWERGSWARGFAREQRDMLQFHRSSAEIRYLGTTNPFASPAWSWPFVRRPMIYYSGPRTPAGRETIMAMGNPVAWLAALGCLVTLLTRLLRRRGTDAATVAVLGFGAMYGPLLLVSAARPATFIYYMLPAVPFMCLAIATVAHEWKKPWADRAMLGFGMTATAMVMYFYPVLTSRPLTEGAVAARQWFRDCDAPTPDAPPAGWCWR
jgi:dolichyl-phosphate-mannose-protein mannosyltransferase